MTDRDGTHTDVGIAREGDMRFMHRALELARFGLYTTDPNPRVGCVLVKNQDVVGEGWHHRAGELHAEALALAAAGEDARGATAYVTLEPCNHTGRTPPCADALIAAGVSRVVAAGGDLNPKVGGQGFAHLRAAGIEVDVGLLEADARELNIGFFSRHERGRPFVRVKLAASLDGRTALASGKSQWITGEAARADVQALRARSSAVCTGVGTVFADDPRLNVRLNYGPWIRQPLRVVLDSHLRAPASAKVLEGGQTLVFTAQATQSLTPANVEIERVPASGAGVDLHCVLKRLAQREVNELLVEGGATLAASFIAQGLADELVLYLAPTILGADSRSLTDITGLTELAQAPRFEFYASQRIGDDLRLTLRPKRA